MTGLPPRGEATPTAGVKVLFGFRALRGFVPSCFLFFFWGGGEERGGGAGERRGGRRGGEEVQGLQR